MAAPRPANPDAPLKLGYVRATARGIELRRRGPSWTYAIIAEVMDEYHGFRRSEDWWRKQCRQAGIASSRRGSGSRLR